MTVSFSLRRTCSEVPDRRYITLSFLVSFHGRTGRYVRECKSLTPKVMFYYSTIQDKKTWGTGLSLH